MSPDKMSRTEVYEKNLIFCLWNQISDIARTHCFQGSAGKETKELIILMPQLITNSGSHFSADLGTLGDPVERLEVCYYSKEGIKGD